MHALHYLITIYLGCAETWLTRQFRYKNDMWVRLTSYELQAFTPLTHTQSSPGHIKNNRLTFLDCAVTIETCGKIPHRPVFAL